MRNSKRFNYMLSQNKSGERGLAPLLPITLEHQDKTISALGLLDTGATVNVLPYSIGREIGAVWEDQNIAINLGGNLANYEARGLMLIETVANFTRVRLAFAWTFTDDVPLILGQANFFMEFDVCFYRSQQAFEVQPKS